jgi:hypothetical protein
MACSCKCCCGCCCDGETGEQKLERQCTSPKEFQGKGTICDVCCDLGEIREDITEESECPGTWVVNGRCLDNPCDSECVSDSDCSRCPGGYFPIGGNPANGCCQDGATEAEEGGCIEADGSRVPPTPPISGHCCDGACQDEPCDSEPECGPVDGVPTFRVYYSPEFCDPFCFEQEVIDTLPYDSSSFEACCAYNASIDFSPGVGPCFDNPLP